MMSEGMAEQEKPGMIGPKRSRRDEEDCGDMPRSLHASQVQNMCSRETSRTVLIRLIETHKRKACELQALADSLPSKLSPEADEALWSILTSLRS